MMRSVLLALAALLPAAAWGQVNLKNVPTTASMQPTDAMLCNTAAGARLCTPAQVGASFTVAGRTLSARAQDVRNVLDWTLPADGGDFSLALARLCAQVPGDFQVLFPGRTAVYAFKTTVTGCGGRNLALDGAGKSVTKLAFAGTGYLFDITQQYQTQTVGLSDMTIASTSATGSLGALRVTYPAVGSSNRPTVDVRNVEIDSPTDGSLPGTFCKGVALVWAWNAHITDLHFTSRPQQPNATSCAAVDVSNSRDVFLTRVAATYGDALLFQSGYAEGLHIDHGTAIGTNWLVSQAASGIVAGGGGVYGVGLTVGNTEVNTYLGGYNLQRWHSAGMAHNHYTRWGQGSNALVGYKLSDVTALRSQGEVFEGGANPGAITFVQLRAGSISTSDNQWTGADVENTGVLADFGAGTLFNSVLDILNQAGASVIDAGTGNLVTEVTASGHQRQYQPEVREQPNGSTLTRTPDNHYLAQEILLVGQTTAGAGVTMTMDGATPNGRNCVPIAAGAEYGLIISLVGRSATGNFAALLPLIDLSRDYQGTVAATPGGQNLTPTQIRGSSNATGTTIYVAGDSAHGCLQLTVSPTTGEAWHYTARVTVTGYQP